MTRIALFSLFAIGGAAWLYLTIQLIGEGIAVVRNSHKDHA